MGLLTPGYWHSTYWTKNYWHNDYWANSRVVVATTPPERTMKIQSENRIMEIPLENRTLTIN